MGRSSDPIEESLETVASEHEVEFLAAFLREIVEAIANRMGDVLRHVTASMYGLITFVTRQT